MIKQITSGDNPIVKNITRLQRRKHRDYESVFIAEGINAVGEALLNGVEIKTVIIRDGFLRENTTNAQIVAELELKAEVVAEVPEKIFEKLVSSETPQGILMVVKKRIYMEDEFFKTGNIIVIDRLQDPGNIGTIIRTADAAGYHGAIIMKGTADIYSPKVVRAAAGSLFRLPVFFLDSPEQATEYIRASSKLIVCATPHAGDFYYDADLKHDVAVVVGNEAGGACEYFMENADIRIKIPMHGTIESLNAAIASAIIMYESVRQKA